jgi:hypothetical protein
MTGIDSGMRTFRVPRLVFENKNLRRLSGDALRLYLFISHRAYRTRSAQVRSTNHELDLELDMDTEDVREAFRDLRDLRLVDITHDGPFIIFHLLHADGSRAVNYLREPLASETAQLTAEPPTETPHVGRAEKLRWFAEQRKQQD